MSNIRDNSPRMWIHIAAVYVFTGLVCVLAYKEYAKVSSTTYCLVLIASQYSKLRTRYNSEHKPHNYTIMVKSVPTFITYATGVK